MPGVVFTSLLKTYGTPYYLKIDIEGADLLCIESLQVPNVPKYLSIESDKLDWSALLHEFDVLTALGYRRFKVVGQHRWPKVKPPNPPLEGKYVDRKFTLTSSGLFGEEAPGQWLSADGRDRAVPQDFQAVPVPRRPRPALAWSARAADHEGREEPRLVRHPRRPRLATHPSPNLRE